MGLLVLGDAITVRSIGIDGVKKRDDPFRPSRAKPSGITPKSVAYAWRPIGHNARSGWSLRCLSRRADQRFPKIT
jgi:hypothetical protein